MFQEGNYDVIRIPMPVEGMNQFISPEILPTKFAYYIENILETPLGSGQVRFGTNFINNIPDASASVIEAFKFVKPDSVIQAVLYVQSYVEDGTISAAVVLTQSTLSFETTNTDFYIVDTYIEINYELNGSNYTFYPKIAEVFNDESFVLTISQSFFPTDIGITINYIKYPVGQIYIYDHATHAITGPLISDLSVACIPRSATFQQTLLICNGVDKIMSWDGTTLAIVFDIVKETQAQSFLRIDGNNFSFDDLGAFDITKYPDGSTISLSINGGADDVYTISATNVTLGVVTITVLEVLADFTEEDIVQLFYTDYPPPFNFLFAGTDRMWALGPGPASIKWRVPGQALQVYYTYLPNTITSWFNENTKTVPSIDISSKHGIQDNLEAICQINGLTAFVGRSRTQVWSGSIPGGGAVLGNLGDFQWQANYDVGLINGNLLVNMPNDVYLISKYGLQSASTLNVARQFAATSSNAIDTIVSKFITNIMSSDVDYRACRSFKYEDGSFGGFKIGRNKVLVSLFQTNFYAWTFFSGDFQRSSTFLDSGNSLNLFIGNSIFQYADGSDGSVKTYGDNDGDSFISFSWIPGIISGKSKGARGFANKRYELVASYPSSFPLDGTNIITITINGYAPKTFEVSDVCDFEEKGDAIGSANFGNLRLSQDYSFINKQLKFKDSMFWVRISGYTLDGPLSFKELKLFGIGERNA